MSSRASIEYNLSTEQIERWQNSLGPLLKRGVKTKIAEKLAGLGDQSVSHFKNILTDFSKGDSGALRSIFDQEDRLRVVAEELALTVSDLRQFLQHAKQRDEDGPFELRIPGFEDLGAFHIVEAMFSPMAGKKVFFAADQITSMSDGTSAWTLDELFQLVTSDDPNLPSCIFIVGPNDEVLERCRRWLRARLEAAHVGTSDARRSDIRAGDVVLQSDFDKLAKSEQTRVVQAATKAHAILVATAASDPAGGICPDRVVLTVGTASSYAAVQYLEHVEALLNRHGYPAKFDEVSSWLEDDPRAGWACETMEAVGIVARHVFDGGKLPLSSGDFVDRRLKRAADLLRARGRGGDAMAVQTWGARALALTAALACQRNEPWLPVEEVARCFTRAADGLVGDGPGVLGVIAGLVEAGLLQQQEQRVSGSEQHLFVAGLGIYLAEHLGDSEVVRKAILRETWHPALLVAAEILGNPTPVIEAINRQSPGVRWVSAAALTWVLGSAAPPSNPSGFADVFARTLWWWAKHPQKPESRTLTLGKMPAPAQAAPRSVRIGGRDPIIVLGQISRIHRESLGRGWTAAKLLELEEDEMASYLADLDGRAPLDEATARLALMLGAPFQSTEFFTADAWTMLMGSDGELGSNSRLSSEDYSLWWRTVAAPRLLAADEGVARVAGIAAVPSIQYTMRQNARGTKIWADALYECIEGGVDGADAVFVEAVDFYSRRGAEWNRQGLRSIWKRLREDTRRRIRPMVGARLCESHPWIVGDRGDAWLMQTFASKSEIRRIWDEWSTHTGAESIYFPWRAFLDSGIDPHVVLKWAISTVVGQAEHILEPVGSPNEYGFFAQVHHVDELPQHQAFHHLLTIDDALLLARIRVFAPEPFAEAAGVRLVEFPPDRLREALLTVCEDPSVPYQVRSGILVGIHPNFGEAERWTRYVEMSPHPIHRMALACQVDCARSEDVGRWCSVNETLDFIKSAQVESIEAHDQIARDLLIYIGNLLRRTRASIDERGAVVERVLASQHLRKHILAGVHGPWWELAIELQGEAAVVGWIRSGHDDQPSASEIRLSAVSLSEVGVWAAVEDPIIGTLVVRRFTQQVCATGRTLDLDLAVRNFASPALDLELPAVHALARCYLLTNGVPAVERIALAVSGRSSGGTLAVFWRGVARELSTPEVLAAVIDQVTAPR